MIIIVTIRIIRIIDKGKTEMPSIMQCIRVNITYTYVYVNYTHEKCDAV